MKLLLASVDFFPTVGGVSTFCHQFATALQDTGAEVTLLVPGGSEKPAGERAPYDLIVDEEADVMAREGGDWIGHELPKAMSRLRALQFEHQFDRFVALHPYYYGQLFVRMGRELGVPVTVAAHGFEVNSQLILRKRIQDFLRRGNGFVSTMREELEFVFQLSDEVLANSNFTANLIQRAGRDGPVDVIGCGLSKEQIAKKLYQNPITAQQAARDQLGIRQDCMLIGTICRLVESKGVDTLLSAVAELPDTYCAIVGDGPMREPLQEQARQLKITDRVHWAGRVSNSERWLWQEAMDISLLLSRPCPNGGVEGFGITILESIAAGTPVIAARTGGIVDVVESGKSGLLVEANDVEAVIEAVRQLRSQPKKAQQLVANGRMNITRRFRWDLIARERLQVWKNAGTVAPMALHPSISPDPLGLN